MIYLFSGDDTKNKIVNYEKLTSSVASKGQVFFINRNNFNKMEIESLYSGVSMFSPVSYVIFENVLEHEETLDFILEKLPLMSESGNSFIFLDSKLNKPAVDAFKKARAEVNIYELPKEKKEKFDNFLLAYAFSDRNKFNLWLYFRQAVDRGVIMEELVGVLFWKIKDMITKRDFRKFTEIELKKTASKLSYILPEARRGGGDAESVFERFLLEVF